MLGLDPAEFQRNFRLRFDPLIELLQRYAQAGYAVEENGCWRLTPTGFLVSNQIIGELIDTLSDYKERRSAAQAQGDFRVEQL